MELGDNIFLSESILLQIMELWGNMPVGKPMEKPNTKQSVTLDVAGHQR